MKEHQILFSAPMVRAILAGAKTQTRRIVKPKYNGDHIAITEWREQGGVWYGLDGWRTVAHAKCPYGQPGDRLWVREAWWQDVRDPLCAVMDADGYVIDRHPMSKATGTIVPVDDFCSHKFWRKCPSIHMPRWASRITLEITGIRVERLQEISGEDALTEGVDPEMCEDGHYPCPDAAKLAFCDLWETINGPDSWDANPWVWCISFRRIA